jgi:type IV secretion system protein VirD4
MEDSSEAHTLVVAPTGSGKGRGVIIPNLLHWDGPAIVIDIKGEAYATTARYRRSLGQRVIVLDPFEVTDAKGDCLNPLDWLLEEPEAMPDSAFMLAETITGTERSSRDPFWDAMAESMEAGLFAYAATQVDPEKRNLGRVWEILNSDDAVYSLAVILDTEKNMNTFAHEQITAFLQHEGEKVRSSVRSTMQQHMRIFSSTLVQKAVSRTTFDLNEVRNGAPITIYIVIPPTKLNSHAAVLRLWLSILLGVITERDHRPEKPTLLIVDELAQIGPLPLIFQAITLLRGYGLRGMLFLQSMSQLRSMWPAAHDTIIENCGNLLTFGHTRKSQSRQIAEILGDIAADDLFDLSSRELAINQVGNPTTIARKLDYLTDPFFAGRYDPNPFYAGPANRDMSRTGRG